MARQPPGNDVDRVDPKVVTVADIARGQTFGGHRHPAQAVFVEGQMRGFGGCARLDLDEREHAPATSDQVDFTARDARTPGKDAPAVKSQPEGRQTLAAAAALFRLLPPHPDESSSARA